MKVKCICDANCETIELVAQQNFLVQAKIEKYEKFSRLLSIANTTIQVQVFPLL